MFTKKNLVVAIIAMSLSYSAILIAKPAHRNGKTHIKLTQAITDSLNSIKAKFDSQLSPDELSKLNNLRDEANKMRTNLRGEIDKIKATELTAEQKKSEIKELMQSHKEDLKNIKTELASVISANKEAFDSLKLNLKNLKKSMTELKENIKASRFILHDNFEPNE